MWTSVSPSLLFYFFLGGPHLNVFGYVSDTELSQFMNSLWNGDVNAATSRDITYSIQGHSDTNSSTDHASSRLFTYVNEAHLIHRPTYSTFISLLNNYYRDTGRAEYQTSSEDDEVTRFLSAVSKTNVMQLTFKFLHSKGYIGSLWSQFESTLRKIWFDFYRRSHSSHTDDTSGFEHVFVGETASSKVSGFHNWIQFYLEEKHGHLNYLGFVFTRKPHVVATHFSWYNKIKNLSTFIVGSSPEFDLAMYTTCYYVHRNGDCRFRMAGYDVHVKTYTVSSSHNLISTAYVVD